MTTYGITEKQAYRIGQTCDAVLGSLHPPTFTPQLYGMAETRIAQMTGRWLYQFDRDKNIAAGGGQLGYPTNERRFKTLAKLYPSPLKGSQFDTTDMQSAGKEVDLYGWYPFGNTGSFVQVIYNGFWRVVSSLPEIVYFKRKGTSDENGEDRTGEYLCDCLSYCPPVRTSDYDYLNQEKLFVRPGASETAIPKYTGWRTIGFQAAPSITDGNGNVLGPILPGMPCYSDGNSLRWPLYSVFTGQMTSLGLQITTDDLYYIQLSNLTVGKQYIITLLPLYPSQSGDGLLPRYQWTKLSQVYEGQ